MKRNFGPQSLCIKNVKFNIRHRKAARVGKFFCVETLSFLLPFSRRKTQSSSAGFLRCFYKRQTAPRNTVQSFWLLLLSAVNATIHVTRFCSNPRKRRKKRGKEEKKRKEKKRERGRNGSSILEAVTWVSTSCSIVLHLIDTSHWLSGLHF